MLHAPNESLVLAISLKVAAFAGNVDLVQALLQQREDRNSYKPYELSDALRLASEEGRLDVARLLIDHGADVEAQYHVRVHFRTYNTALQVASSRKHLNVVQLLLDRGAKPQTDTGALTVAASYGSIDIIRLLIDHGADIKGRDQLGQTALQEAAFHGHLEVMQLLL
ncbi:ankyrin repeat-containing domain protein, partial [Vararia minispora EC-137]